MQHFSLRHYRTLSVSFLLITVMMLSACGFKMRGEVDLPFTTVYSNISKNSAFGIYIVRLLRASSPHIKFVDTAPEAQVRLMQLSIDRTRSEVSLDAEGKVEEYELGIVFIFSLVDAKGNQLISPTRLMATRLLPYSESEQAAKLQEMQLLYEDMEKSIADRLYRRVISDEVVQRYNQFNPK